MKTNKKEIEIKKTTTKKTRNIHGYPTSIKRKGHRIYHRRDREM